MSGVRHDPLDVMEQHPLDWLETAEESELLTLVEIVRAARGVLTQTDYETPHHVRLRAALNQLDET